MALPKTNRAPKNRPSQRETSILTIHFQVRTVRFRECSSLEAIKSLGSCCFHLSCRWGESCVPFLHQGIQWNWRIKNILNISKTDHVGYASTNCYSVVFQKKSFLYNLHWGPVFWAPAFGSESSRLYQLQGLFGCDLAR